MADVNDDDISITSTVLSEQKSEYEVETILAEFESDEGTKYLVQWAGYPPERCTWEPVESFTDDQTITDWEEKKREIAQGKEKAFDIAGWETRLRQLGEEKEDRKRRREAKRRKLGLSAAAPSSTSTDNPPSIVESPQRNLESGISHSSESRRDPQTLEQVYPSRRAQIREPVLFGTGSLSRQKKSHSTESHKIFNLSTKRRYEKAKRDEPHPNVRELELMRPGEWAPISLASTTKPGPSRLISSNAHETELRVSRAIDAPGSSEASPIEPRRGPKNLHPLRSSDSLSFKEINDPQRPTEALTGGRSPKVPRKVLVSGNLNRAVEHGELLVTMFYGLGKKKIGHVKLCGMNFSWRRAILKTKVKNEIEIWFQHLRTLEEYEVLCRNGNNVKFIDGWVNGYADTNSEVENLAAMLQLTGRIAMCQLRSDPPADIIAYSPNSPEFEFLSEDKPPGPVKSLNIALRSPLKLVRQSGSRHGTGQSMELEVNSSDIRGVVAQTNTGTLPTQSEINNLNSSIPPSCVAPASTPLATHIPEPSATALVLASQPLETKNDYDGSEPMDLDTENTQLPMTVSPNRTEQTHVNLDDFFKQNFQISFSTLTTVSGSNAAQKAEMFYLWFPDDSDISKTERGVIMGLLKSHTDLIYSNHVREDWERFVSTTKKGINGVVLFHESFNAYHTIPSFRDLLRKGSTFWNVSLFSHLQFADRPLHFQRLFPHGCVLLITEDFMLRDPRGTLVTLVWFYEQTKKRLYPGSWKIMFRPDVLNWLLTLPEREDKSYKKGTWLAMYHWIMKLSNSSDGDISNICGDYSESSVISPPKLPSYGSRRETDHPDIPKGTTQEVRNADHLAEFFAGWGLVNCHRFRRFYILTYIKPAPERWARWQHIEVRVGAKDFMAAFNIVDYQTLWEKAKVCSRSSNNSNAEATPYTPRTPKPPPTSARQHSSGFALQAHSKTPYPQPYQ